MQITHEEARWLIEYDADRALNSEKQRVLTAHFQECESCRLHAVEMNNLENILREVMKKHWNQHPLPLSMDSINIRTQDTNSLLAWRVSLVSIAMVTFFFLIWGFKMTAFNSSGQTPLGNLSVPTPSVQSTTASTITISTQCNYVIYEVQEFDTLDGIADKFFVSREEIMAFNNMRSDQINTSMELFIPQCDITPTDTVRTPTTTLTPNIQLTIFTPG